MAQENAVKFMELLAGDAGLQEKLKAATEAYDGPKDDERAVFDAVIAPLAAEAGLPCTFEEGLAAATADRDLSDEELDAVAGGKGACYYVGWDSDGADAWTCRSGPLSGIGAACAYLGLTLGG